MTKKPTIEKLLALDIVGLREMIDSQAHDLIHANQRIANLETQLAKDARNLLHTRNRITELEHIAELSMEWAAYYPGCAPLMYIYDACEQAGIGQPKEATDDCQDALLPKET